MLKEWLVKSMIQQILNSLECAFKYAKELKLYNEQWWIDFEDALNDYSNVDFNEL